MITAKFLLALMMVESGIDHDSLGDYRNGIPQAYGALQIRAIYVEDVNRIYGTSYAHNDAFDKGVEITTKYLQHYGSTERLGHPATLEDLARIHNSGPMGHRKNCSKIYWQKVKAVLEGL